MWWKESIGDLGKHRFKRKKSKLKSIAVALEHAMFEETRRMEHSECGHIIGHTGPGGLWMTSSPWEGHCWHYRGLGGSGYANFSGKQMVAQEDSNANFRVGVNPDFQLSLEIFFSKPKRTNGLAITATN
jgi:hypothetical protein